MLMLLLTLRIGKPIGIVVEIDSRDPVGHLVVEKDDISIGETLVVDPLDADRRLT